MAETDTDDKMLEALLTGARDAAWTEPSPDLMTRVLADANAAQPGPATSAPTRSLRPRGGALARLLRPIGGWPAAAGLVAASLFGVWIGIAAPDLVLPGGPEALTDGQGTAYLAEFGTEIAFLADGG
ncbi:hypothetical protein [Salinihabitans flavidus]|nr:hypothetical protein [Salinihabitans flavidus]